MINDTEVTEIQTNGTDGMIDGPLLETVQVGSSSSKPVPEPSPKKPDLAVHLERFAAAIAKGANKAEAAEECGRKKGSAHYLHTRTGVQERIAELQKIAHEATNHEVAREAVRERAPRPIPFDRNDIIMGLADLAGLGNTAPAKSERTRYGALMGLVDIFMLRAKSIADLRNLIGWTEDELQELIEHGTVPGRIRLTTGISKAEDLLPPTSLRTEKNDAQAGDADCSH